jgi:predicted membrane channel-forming protein YqfA (hemolysin III family)
VFALLFNTIGVFDYVMSRAQGAAYMASAGMTPAQVTHYQAMPTWMIGVWAIGVFGAFAGSILLLLRRRLTVPVFIASLAAFLLGIFYHYVLTDGGTLMGRQMVVTDVVITALLVGFIWYSARMTTRGVIR